MTKKEDVAILLLHDTIEDTNLNFRDIKKGY
jgi:(p)ppGpp synthase/HD superfamily hydrolase